MPSGIALMMLLPLSLLLRPLCWTPQPLLLYPLSTLFFGKYCMPPRLAGNPLRLRICLYSGWWFLAGNLGSVYMPPLRCCALVLGNSRLCLSYPVSAPFSVCCFLCILWPPCSSACLGLRARSPGRNPICCIACLRGSLTARCLRWSLTLTPWLL